MLRISAGCEAKTIVHIAIGVEDNGSGISPANAEKIFDLFFTTRREQDGTGMGLGIVQAMLNAHHGAIRIKQCSAGRGSMFEIEV